MIEHGPATVATATDPTDIDPCPYCGTTTGVQPTPGTSPGVKAWSCTSCRTDWAITVVNPQPYLDRLAATVEQLGATRSVLRQVCTLADDASTITDQQLRDRLLALASCAR
jgi:transposase-like protein